MPETGFEAGEGSATQLPRGAAEAVNDGTEVQAPPEMAVEGPESASKPSEDESAPQEAPDLEMAELSDYEPEYEPVDEDGLFLTGPTTRPGEPVSSGVAAFGPQRLSPELLRALPQLSQAAQQPGASANLLQLVAFLTREANR